MKLGEEPRRMGFEADALEFALTCGDVQFRFVLG